MGIRPVMQTTRNATRSRGRGAQTVYESLRRDILELVLEPGSPLDEAKLATAFSMSRTPVREALVRLLAEGLVTSLPNRNTIVSPIEFSQIGAYLDALTLMYRVTARGAALHHTREQFRAIEHAQLEFLRATRSNDGAAMLDSNREFHLAIARCSNNKYYTQLLTNILDEGNRIQMMYYAWFNNSLPHEYIEEHEIIVNAIKDKAPERADEGAKKHALQVSNNISKFLFRSVGDSIELF